MFRILTNRILTMSLFLNNWAQIFMTLLIPDFYIFRGIDCINDTTIVAFTHTDPGNYGNRAVKNETVILHTDSGELIKLLSMRKTCP